jgi:hypothetical protein
MNLLPFLPATSSQTNVFTFGGPNAEIHGDYDQTGTADKTLNEWLQRLTRPGAIVLPNINFSAGIPLGPVSLDLSTSRDCDNSSIENATDASELTELIIKSPSNAPLLADEVVLRVDTNDVDRFHLFRQSGGAASSWPIVLGKTAGNEFSITVPPALSFQDFFAMEALTLPGAPIPTPSGPVPNSPPSLAIGTDASGAIIFAGSPGTPPYPTRGPGEIWVELQHKRQGAILPNNGDLALFLIARFILQSNIEQCERIYVTYMKGSGLKARNHDFVYDLMEACWEAFSLGGPGSFSRNTSMAFTPSAPSDRMNPDVTTANACCLSPGKLYIVDGGKYSDEWVQDQFEMGYCSVPGNKGFNVAIHCKRDRPLKNFITSEIGDVDIGLFNDLAGTEPDSVEYGGNIEVSPPVFCITGAQGKSNAGPSFPAHPEAPFGKILCGDFLNSYRNSHGEGKLHADTRNFLHDQHLQPIVPFNTSWLGVGHIDEVMSFVPSNRIRGSALCIASVYMMNKIIEETMKISMKDGRTNFHRGKFENHRFMMDYCASNTPIPDVMTFGTNSLDSWASYAEISAEDLYNGEVRNYSEEIRDKFMIPIEKRLKNATDHSSSDIIKVPLYFKVPYDRMKPFGHNDNVTVAETVGMVNMQVANEHLFIPKPFGPRMKRPDAKKVIKTILGIGTSVRFPYQAGVTFWAFPGISLERVARIFAIPQTQAERNTIIQGIINDSAALPHNLQSLADGVRSAIQNANPSLPLSSGIFNDWYRLTIPEDSVDIIETYMTTVLENIGCTVHFVDDWFYHVGWGEAHCATNAKRTPKLSAPWWKAYNPEKNYRYNPAT